MTTDRIPRRRDPAPTEVAGARDAAAPLVAPGAASRQARPAVRVHRMQRTLTQTFLFASLSALFLAGLLTAHSTPGSIALVILAIVCAVAAARAARAGVVISDDGVVVRDLTHTHRLAWSEVAGLSPSTDDFGHRTAAVLTVDGRRIRVFALNGLAFWDADSDAYMLTCGRVGHLLDERKP